MTVWVKTTVTTPASTSLFPGGGVYDLVGLDTVKDDMGLTGQTSDAFLRRAIVRASTEAAQFCNRVFVPEKVTDLHMIERDSAPYQVPGGVDVLQASRWPIITLTSLTEADNLLVENTDFRTDYQKGEFFRLPPNLANYTARWPAMTITVIYSAGYAAIPDDIQDAVTRMVKARYDARNRDPYLRGELVEGVGRRDFWVAGAGQSGNMPPDISDILENYRVPVVA